MNIERALQIDGWMSPKELFWLANYASKAKTIVEFGCYKGRSTRALVDNTEGKVYAVDPWEGSYLTNDNKHRLFDQARSYNEFYANLADVIANGKVIVCQHRSEQFIGPCADFFFIDGDHHFNSVINDIRTAQNYINQPGIIAGHDYGHPDWPGVKEAVDLVFPTAQKVGTIWWVEVLK